MDREQQPEQQEGQQGQDSKPQRAEQAGEELTAALEATLAGLNGSIEKMEEIVRKIEAGDPDWQESLEMLAEANELANESNRKLDQVVQNVVYGSEDGEEVDRDEDDED